MKSQRKLDLNKSQRIYKIREKLIETGPLKKSLPGLIFIIKAGMFQNQVSVPVDE